MNLNAEIELQRIMQPWYDKYPDRRMDLLEEAGLFVDEIQDGGSWSNEVEHLIDSLNENVGEV